MLHRCLSLVYVIELQICTDPIPTLIERRRAPFHFGPLETFDFLRFNGTVRKSPYVYSVL